MTDCTLTRHAETRMRQRGIRERDVLLILAHATRIDDETWFMYKRDVRRAIKERKQEIRALERIAGCKVVARGESVVTAYRSRPADQKRTLRQGKRNGCAK